LPLANAPLRVGVEVLLLLVQKCLCLQAGFVLVAELLFRVIQFLVALLCEELNEFLRTLALLVLFLRFSHLKLFVAYAPELREVALFLLFQILLLLLAFDLQSARPLNGLFHFILAALLVFKKSVSLVLGLGNLLVQHLLFVVAQATERFNLFVNHSLAHREFVLFLLLFAVSLLCIESLLITSEALNAALFLEFLFFDELLETDLILVSLDNVFFHLSHLFLALKLADLLALDVLFHLSLDELTLEHLFLERLDVVHLEFFELVRDGLGVGLTLFVFLFKLLAHLFVVLVELLFLEVTPVLIDFFVDSLLARLQAFLGLAFVEHVGVEQLAFQRLDHVLLVVEVSVGTLDLLSAKLVLVLLLLGVNFTSGNLLFFELLNTVFFTLMSESLKSVWPVLDSLFTMVL